MCLCLEAFLKQKAALEHQAGCLLFLDPGEPWLPWLFCKKASSLAMEYQQRKMHEDLLKKQARPVGNRKLRSHDKLACEAEMHREMNDMQRRIHMELQDHQQQ